MAERDALGQSVTIERETSGLKSRFHLSADVLVTDYRGDTHHGVVEKGVKGIILNTTRKGEYVNLSKSDLTADVVAEVLEGAKELVAKFPGYYMDEPDEIAGDFGKYDVQIESATIEKRETVREIDSKDDN